MNESMEAQMFEVRGYREANPIGGATGPWITPLPGMGPRRTDGKPLGIEQLCDDGVWWKTAGKDWIEIAKMERSHASNLMPWLERRATHYKWNYGMAVFVGGYQPSGDMACDAWDHEMDAFHDTPDLEWLHSTALFRNIKARAESVEPPFNNYAGLPARLRGL